MLEPSIEHLQIPSEESVKMSPTTVKAASCHKKNESFSIPEPYRSHLQTLTAGLYINIFMYLPFIFWAFIAFVTIYLGFIGRVFLLMYSAHIYFDHKQRCSTVNGIGFMPFRNNVVSKYLRDYFPVDLIKTAELPPNRNYLVVSFPHGIIGTGVSVNMGLNIAKWLELFPGVRPKAATLDMYFRTPFLRELFRSWGMVSCSREALLLQLDKSNNPNHPHNLDGYTSNAVALLVGGAHEAMDCRPNEYILTLEKRKGFVKIAIRSGSPIVPSFSFGEVDILHQKDNPPGSTLRKFQTFVKNTIGFSPLIVTGRGLLRTGFGLLPFRKPIVQVIGAPIEVQKMDDPDPKYVDEIHHKVIDSLNAMFEKYKHQYLENPEAAKLVIN